MKTAKLLLALFATVGATTAFASFGSSPDAVGRMLAALPEADAGCEWLCVACSTTKHNIFEAGVLDPDAWSAHSEWCQSGSCPAGHECGGGVSWAPGDFERAVYFASADELRAVLRQRAEQVVYNQERGALQVMGCNSQVLASYPIELSITD